LFYAPDYGAGAFDYLLETGLTESEIRANITTELLKDERTRKVEITGTLSALSVTITPYGASKPLGYTLSIDAVASVIAIVKE